jgi:predicted Zn finger-like uncharacterized protein
MLIICPHCATSYQVEPSAVGPTGRSVRCVRCRTVWFAANTTALAEIAAAHRAEVAQFAGAELASDAPAEPEPAPILADAEHHGEGAAAATTTALAAAEIEVVDDAPPIAAADPTGDGFPDAAPPASERPVVTLEGTTTAADAEAGGGDIETVAARRVRKAAKTRRQTLRLPGLPLIILMLAVLDLGLIGWRTDIVRLAPQMAPLYAAIGLPVNVRGLVFTDVTVETRSQEGMPVLTIQGNIVSTASRAVEVPRLRFAARNVSGAEIYRWTALPERAVLAPGEMLAFQSRLASPPLETHDVLVRFFTRRDLRNALE